MPEVDAADAEVLGGHDDIEVGTAHQVEERIDPFLLERSGYEVASDNLSHASLLSVRLRDFGHGAGRSVDCKRLSQTWEGVFRAVNT